MVAGVGCCGFAGLRVCLLLLLEFLACCCLDVGFVGIACIALFSCYCLVVCYGLLDC